MAEKEFVSSRFPSTTSSHSLCLSLPTVDLNHFGDILTSALEFSGLSLHFIDFIQTLRILWFNRVGLYNDFRYRILLEKGSTFPSCLNHSQISPTERNYFFWGIITKLYNDLLAFSIYFYTYFICLF